MADQPLWEIIHNAYLKAYLAHGKGSAMDPSTAEAGMRISYAAELRALADIVERRGDAKLDLDPGETADWLRAEADRAEKGES
jgi:hypothetical protein